MGGMGMALGIGERFLGDAEQRGAVARGQRQRFAAHDQARRETATLLCLFHQQRERSGQAEVVEQGGPESVGHAADFDERLVQPRQSAVEHVGRTRRRGRCR